ncbi:MAG: hypothetical protein Q8R30_04180 [bacterium]|nr:hypothetical protein [bacterium]
MDQQETYTTRCVWQPHSDHTLVVDCSDPRFPEARHEFLTRHCKVLRYDSLFVPGGPVASTLANAFCYVDQERIRMLHGLHKFIRVIGIAHFDCSYYKRHHSGAAHVQLHEHQITDLGHFKDAMATLAPGAHVEVYHVGPNADNFIEYTRIL